MKIEDYESYVNEKKKMLNILDDVIDHLKYRMKDNFQSYEKLGTQSQVYDWNSETKKREYLYNDDGTPKMQDDYGYVEKKFEELDDESKLAIKCYEKMIDMIFEISVQIFNGKEKKNDKK